MNKRPTTHCCKAAGCQTMISTKHLFCYPHWKRVPDFLQAKIVEAWKDGLRHRIHPTHEYAIAVTEARNLLKEGDDKKLARQMANSPLFSGGAA